MGPAKILVITACVAVVFSLGLIVGQHLLVDDGLSPVVSTADGAPPGLDDDAPRASSDESGLDDDSLQGELYSFYDVLTASDHDDDPMFRDEYSIAEEAFESLSEADESSSEAHQLDDRAFGIDDDDEPNTEDGAPPARYTLQVASHPTMEQARTEMDHLRTIDIDAHVVAAEVPGQGKYYRIRVGKFQNRDQARAMQSRIDNEHDVYAFVTPL